MKLLNKLMFLCIGIMFFSLSSCQDEVIEETPPNQEEIIQPNSNLANLMRYTAANDGSVDNILDNSDCFTVNLPVTIEANGVTLTIETLDDLSLLEAIFDASNTDNDELEFLFPITIILNDYTEINIDSVEELNDFIETCIANDDIIECANFVYPISFSIYNTDFQVIDTVIIDNDYELYIFLEGLDNDNQGVVLASLNFPVSLQYANGEIVEATNNQELEEAINAAEETCDYTDCNEATVVEDLKSCHWTVAAYNANNEFLGFDFYFNDNNLLQIIYGTGALTVGGTWSTTTENGHVIVSINELTDFTELEGDWMVESCEDERYVLTQETTSQVVEMVLEQDCQETPFNCFEDMTVSACDFNNNGSGIFELEALVLGDVVCNVDYIPTFHETLADAESNTNAIAQPNAYVNITSPQTIYLRIEALNGQFQVYEITLVLENCSSNCSLNDLEVMLLDCDWTTTSFAGSNFGMFNINFNVNNEAIIFMPNGNEEYTANWSISQGSNAVEVTISNISGGNIQIIEGTYNVVECTSEQLILHDVTNSNNELVLDRDCVTCNNTNVLTNDLIIYMPFGNEVKDLISGEVVNNFTFLTEDRAGNPTCAVSFDGSENFSIPVTAQNQLVQGDNFSVSIWFKMQNDDVGNFEIIFQKGNVNSEGFQLAVYDSNTPLVSDTTNGYGLWDNDWNQQVDVQWDNTDWHHLVITRDANNTIRLYRDGQLRNIDENSNFNIDSDSLTNYTVGQFFIGHLDDLRVYKRTLSPNEVGELYNLEADCFQCL